MNVALNSDQYAYDLEKAFAFSSRHVGELRPYQAQAVRAVREQLDAMRPILLHVGTGGGKTRIANEVVASAIRKGDTILWIAKDWPLLYQAACDFCRRKKGGWDRIGRIGGDRKELHPIPKKGNKNVFYWRFRISCGKLRPGRGRAHQGESRSMLGSGRGSGSHTPSSSPSES